MKVRNALAAVVGVVLLVLAITPLAYAQATRTWVSGVGDDVNPCSRTAPCKTFAGAISKTGKGGIINALDPGGFGAVTITKSITIMGPPGMAEILASATSGITINGANIRVVLRNLDINGSTSSLSGPEYNRGAKGINFLQGKSLRLENVTIEKFQYGLYAANIPGSLTANRLDITDAQFGMWLVGSSTLKAAITNASFVDGDYGVVSHGANVSLTDCLSAGNVFAGIFVGSSGRLSVDDCLVRSNGTGLGAEGSGQMRVSSSTIVANTNGVSAATGGQVLSRGNNTLEDNAFGNAFTGLYAPK